MLSGCCCFFFFSSRRRHTRYIGDWSSDVCSSDLNGSAARKGHWQHGGLLASPATQLRLGAHTGAERKDSRPSSRHAGTARVMNQRPEAYKCEPSVSNGIWRKYRVTKLGQPGVVTCLTPDSCAGKWHPCLTTGPI